MAKSYEKYAAKDKAEAPAEKSYLKYISQAMEGEEAFQKQQDENVKNLLILGGQGATFGFGDEIVGGMNALAGNEYEKSRDAARARVEEAREALPYVGPVVEAGGSAITSAVAPPLRGGTMLRELGLAGLQAVGENTEIENLPEEAAFSVGTAGLANGAVGLAKKAVSPPEEILANAAGARGINYRKGETFVGADSADEYADRLKDPAGLAARLDKIGFFGFGKKRFDGGKFVRDGGIEEAISPVSTETMMERVQSGVSTLGDANRKLLAGKRIPLTKVKATLDQAAMDFIPAGEDYAKRQAMAKELAETAFADLVLAGKAKPGDKFLDAAAVEDIKRKWQKTVASSYDSGKALSDITNVGVEARRKFSTALDKLVDGFAGPDYAKNNDMIRDLKTIETLIHDKASRQRGYSGGGARLTNAKHFISSMLENTVYHPQADIARARVGQGLRTVPGQMLENTVRRTPVEFMNSTVDQTPPVQVPFRKPDSVPNIPEQFIRTPLPRTTEGLLKNKKFVLGKVAQMAPEMFEAVSDVMENEPERLPELAQVIAMKLPHFFERDKYNRFDGRILNEADKNKAIKDTLLRQDISSIEQAKIITKLNKEGLYDN